ncbi:ABC transporter ATP-binding protein [Bengtsoniella intestinalis]
MVYLRPYRLQLGLVALCLVGSSACTVMGSYLLKPAINDYIIPGDFEGLAQTLLLMGGLYLTAALLTFLYTRLMVYIGQNAVANIRRDLFEKMQTLPLRYFDTHPHGDLMSRFTNDIDTVSEALNNSFASFLSCGLTFAGTIIMMIILSPVLTLVTFLSLFVMMNAIRIVGGKSGAFFKGQQQTLGAVNGYVEEMITGQKVVKVFCREAPSKAEFAVKNEAYRQSATTAQSFAGAMMPMMGNLGHINYAITCCVGGILAVQSGDLGTLVTFLNYSRQVVQPVSQVAQQSNTILSAVAGAERVFDMMEQASEIDNGTVTLVSVEETNGTLQEAQNRTGLWAWKTAEGLVPLAGLVRFTDVDFGYVEGQKVLKNLSLHAKAGQQIAFVGSTGAGKTTITNLINRFYDIQRGTITFDGIEIRDIRKESLRRSLGMVLQDTHLFTGTIADNIRFGMLDATDAQVEAAAKLANAHGFIRHLPKGYDTVITDDGGSLSQGERQLLNIARAACADAPVLILDEATSSIDTHTEGLIQQGMDKLMAGRTVFIIAHRLSTVRNAKAILVLEQGEVLERGTHDELLQNQGRYHQLYTGQAELD